MQLLEENEDFRKAITEYDETINELTTQMETLKSAQRNSGLLEEELKTLAASLGRLQLEKNHMEKEFTLSKSESDKIKENMQCLKVCHIHYTIIVNLQCFNLMVVIGRKCRAERQV